MGVSNNQGMYFRFGDDNNMKYKIFHKSSQDKLVYWCHTASNIERNGENRLHLGHKHNRTHRTSITCAQYFQAKIWIYSFESDTFETGSYKSLAILSMNNMGNPAWNTYDTLYQMCASNGALVILRKFFKLVSLDVVTFISSCATITKISAHYTDVITSAVASQITDILIVCSTVCSAADQRKHQSSASVAFVNGIHR